SQRGEFSVLLVDAHSSLTERIVALLQDPERARYRVRSVLTLAAAIALLEQRSFDAILLSLELPECPGVDAVRRLVAACPGVPTIALNQVEDEPLALFAVQAGAQDYLSSVDLRPVALRRSISHAIERKRAEER